MLSIVGGFAFFQRQSNEQLSAVRAELEAFRREQISSQKQPRAFARDFRTAPVQPAEPPRQEEREPEDAKQGERPRSEPDAPSVPIELVTFTMDSAFKNESEGGRAAASAAEDIRDTVVPLLKGRSTVEAVECRSSMCRLSSVQDDMDSYTDFAYQVTHSDVCRQCFWTKTGETGEGKPILTMYIAREGAQLPQP
jgi:hypothetical protein